MRLPFLLAAPVLVVGGLYFAPTAAADCTTAGNTTVCSVGGAGQKGPVVPYPCGYDYYCNDDYNWFIP